MSISSAQTPLMERTMKSRPTTRQECPIKLCRWQVIADFFSGYLLVFGQRVDASKADISEIVELDEDTGILTARSGASYQLIGPPRRDKAMKRRIQKTYGASLVIAYTDVSEEISRLADVSSKRRGLGESR